MIEQLQFSTPVAATYEANRTKFLPYGSKVIVRFDFKSKTWVIVNHNNEVLWSAPELILKDVQFVSNELGEDDEGAQYKSYGCGNYGYGYSGKAQGTLVKEIPESPVSPLRRMFAKFFGESGRFTSGHTLSACESNSSALKGAGYLILESTGQARIIDGQWEY